MLEFGVPREIAHSAMRWSLGRDTTTADLDEALAALQKADAALLEEKRSQS